MSAQVEPATGERPAPGSSAPASAPGCPGSLGPGVRLALGALAWSALACASPGVLARDGLWPLALAGVAVWGWAGRRRGRFAFWIDALTGGLGWAYLVHWSAYVFWFCLVWMGVGFALWLGATGALLRRMPRAPLALLVPVVWVGVETLRTITPTPIGLSWMRLGVYVHDLEPLNGAARVFGTGGLSFVVAALAGLLADLVQRARGERTSLAAPLGFGLGPLVLALVLAHVVPAPQTRPGPHVLSVQPAIPQERKGRSDRGQAFRDSVELTHAGLEEERAAGRAVDLVIWGETMFLAGYYVEDDVVAAFRGGARAEEYWQLEEHHLLRFQDDLEDALTIFYDPRRGLFDEGTCFLTGIEAWCARDGRLARQNAGVLFDADGRPVGRGAKTNLVPGAENFLGFERFEFARAIIREIAGYVPDLVPGLEPAVLELPARSGDRFRFGLSICFDNAFDAPYVEPARRGADFHVVLSNEGWFKSSLELDQMVAFSRLAAIATGRAFVRATNTGVSCVLGADGRELSRLVEDGTDREVPGTLATTVPVPVDSGRLTPFVRWNHVWTGLWLALPALLALVRRRS